MMEQYFGDQSSSSSSKAHKLILFRLRFLSYSYYSFWYFFSTMVLCFTFFFRRQINALDYHLNIVCVEKIKISAKSVWKKNKWKKHTLDFHWFWMLKNQIWNKSKSTINGSKLFFFFFSTSLFYTILFFLNFFFFFFTQCPLIIWLNKFWNEWNG